MFNNLLPLPEIGGLSLASVLPPKDDIGNQKVINPNSSASLLSGLDLTQDQFGWSNPYQSSANDPRGQQYLGDSNDAERKIRHMQDQTYQDMTSPKTKQMQQPPAGNMPQPTGDPTKLFNFTGLLVNPNILTRLGVGYNMGGLLGALGMGLTDMNPNSQQNQKSAMDEQAFLQWQKQQRLNGQQPNQY